MVFVKVTNDYNSKNKCLKENGADGLKTVQGENANNKTSFGSGLIRALQRRTNPHRQILFTEITQGLLGAEGTRSKKPSTPRLLLLSR